jgi:hypothetical protein
MPNPFPDIADGDLELLSQEECIQLAIATINKSEISGNWGLFILLLFVM